MLIVFFGKNNIREKIIFRIGFIIKVLKKICLYLHSALTRSKQPNKSQFSVMNTT